MLSGSAGVSSGVNSYGNDRNDIEYANESGIFHADYKKNDDLIQMLDSNKDNLKLEAMKRIIGMVAKGRDASNLFPAVVKNVVSKNIEIKKLVYVYLVRYAEEQQDLALLSISTFQRALKDPNQLIRASALRVLSSIRVTMIVPIVMLAIRDSASDMSPYVRKTAAHAIPKLYSLDPDQKNELTTVIEKLLSDRTTLVVGSAVMAFEEVCPERTDLIHKNYRKFCNLLVDVDEWGQVLIINMLTRYARTQFVDPNNDDFIDINENNKPFYDDSSSGSEKQMNLIPPRKNYCLDIDHRLLLRQAKPLLQSRNASVVMSVAQLYHHIAPKDEVTVVAKALIRLLRSHKEVQSIVLTCIVSMSAKRKTIFEPYLKSFFVRTCDQTHIKLLKLDILTNLASERNISNILQEFKTYISSNDKEFVAHTIQAIGRCATSISEVTDTCLNGLVFLLSNKDENVVAESVVVIKKLLQTQTDDHFDIIIQMAKLLDFIHVPAARASILWLIGEYNQKVPQIAPDVLRKLAKCFVSENDVVKQQILNLAVKLYLTDPKPTELLRQYVFNLARYDQNYDIRDRARFLKQFFLSTGEQQTFMSQSARNVFLTVKQAPTLSNRYEVGSQFQLGSLSHYLNIKANGYQDLPSFPQIAPDNSVRNVELSLQYRQLIHSTETENKPHLTDDLYEKRQAKEKLFYMESDSDTSTSSNSSSESSSNSSSSSDHQYNDMQNMVNDALESSLPNSRSESEDSNNSECSSSNSNSEVYDNPSSHDHYNFVECTQKCRKTVKCTEAGTKNFSMPNVETLQQDNLDLLLNMNDIPPVGPVMTPSLDVSTPSKETILGNLGHAVIDPNYIPVKSNELLNKVNGFGLEISYRFIRSPHIFSTKMISVELVFTNRGNMELTDILIGKKSLQAGMHLKEFPPIQVLNPKQSRTCILGLDCNDSTQPANFEIISSSGTSCVTLKAPIGELIQSVILPESLFVRERAKLRGMTEHSSSFQLNKTLREGLLHERIFEVINVANIQCSEKGRSYFAGQTISSKSLVLIVLQVEESHTCTLTVNCDKMVIGSMLFNEIKTAIKQ
ncbi:AP-3 complex subunit beta-2 isoform X1 [Sabethes cyaneus]|uniref:AP-3 complex subunit beta-2 isoform X1 n=1 Tax=Sabethes cyaneus TaxID=53552 RepID=UPI00237D9D38|nr:AP-3 complex subunit beta-2 isoform X1 [Sabethes cyaneus]